MRPGLVRAVVVLVIVAFVGVGASALLGGGGSSRSAGPNRPPPSASPTSAAYAEPFPDRGSPAEVARVKKVLPQLLADAVAVQRLPADAERRAVVIGDPAAVRARRTAIDRVWVPGQRAGRAAELEQALRAVAREPSYHPFDDNRLVLTRWQGVVVRSGTVTALLVGHQEFRLGEEGWQADPDAQYQVALGPQDASTPPRWGLSGLDRVPLPSGG